MAARRALGARHADGGGRCGGERHVKTSLERECHTLQAERRAVCFSRHKRSILSRKGPDYGWGLGAGQGMFLSCRPDTWQCHTPKDSEKSGEEICQAWTCHFGVLMDPGVGSPMWELSGHRCPLGDCPGRENRKRGEACFGARVGQDHPRACLGPTMPKHEAAAGGTSVIVNLLREQSLTARGAVGSTPDHGAGAGLQGTGAASTPPTRRHPLSCNRGARVLSRSLPSTEVTGL